jgi:hypothetical protein
MTKFGCCFMLKGRTPTRSRMLISRAGPQRSYLYGLGRGQVGDRYSVEYAHNPLPVWGADFQQKELQGPPCKASAVYRLKILLKNLAVLYIVV